MKAIDRLKIWAMNRRINGAMQFLLKQNALPFGAFGSLFEAWNADSASDSARSLADYFAADPWFPPAVMVPAEIIASWPLRIMRQRGSEQIPAESSAAHRLLNVKPNDWQTPSEFKIETLSWLRMTGNFYWRKIPPGKKIPTALWIMDPYKVNYDKDPYRGVTRYYYGDSREPIPPDEVIRGRLWNPKDNIDGMGIGQPLKSTLRLRNAATKFNLNQLTKGGLPDDIWFEAMTPTTVENATKARDAYMKDHAGVGRSHVPMFLGNWKPHTLSRTQKDMQFAELLRASQEDMGAGSRVPPAMLGNLEHATYSNIDAQREMIIDYVCLPLATYFRELLDAFLLPLFDASLTAEFDLSSEPVVQERFARWIERIDKLANPGGGRPLILQNEGREMLRRAMPQYADIIKGDLPSGGKVWVPFNLMEQGQEAVPPARQQSGINALFGLKNGDGVLKLDRGVIDGVTYWGEELHAKAKEISEKFHKELIRTRSIAALAEIGSDIDFDFVSPRILEYIRRKPQIFADEWVQTTLDNLAATIEEALNQGETIHQIQERIEHVFDGRKNNALTVARTEATPGFNFASMEAWEQSGVVEGKEWLHNTERHQNVPGDNGVIGLNDYFNVNGSQLLYPGDPAGPAAEIINCGCTHLPVLMEKGAASPEEKKRARSAHHREIVQWAKTLAPSLVALLGHYEKQTLEALRAYGERDGGPSNGRKAQGRVRSEGHRPQEAPVARGRV